MNLLIRNINKIKEASIKLEGLTVIAGENDSGKSTIGKVLFTTIKSLANTDVKVASKRQNLLSKHVNSLYRRSYILRQSTSFPHFTNDFIKELMSIDETSLGEYYQGKKDDIERLDVPPRTMSLMLKDLNNIFVCIKNKDKRSANISTDVQYLIESEFMNKICSANTEESFVELTMDDDEGNKLSFSIRDDMVTRVEVSDGDFINDATYIESPLYVHLLDSLMYATSYREIPRSSIGMRPMVPSHIEDLMSKINDLRLLSGRKANEGDLETLMANIMGGDFVYDNRKRSLFFKKKDGMMLSPINVASGIKSFGLVQMLLRLNAISSDKVLIWDEPENHLHPQWQIEFADIMVQLAKSGVPVLISTHSPYFIQGVRYFSAKRSLDKYVHYYLSEGCDDGLSIFNDVTNDLNRIFLKLAEPLNNIVNIL